MIMLLTATTARSDLPPDAAARIPDKRSYPSHDGAALFYRHWPSVRGATRDAIVLLHREHEHSGRVQHLADELALDDFSFFAWDARGHGHSPGVRGDAPSVGCLTKDLDAFVRHIGAQHGIACERIHVVALGASGVLAAAWVHDYAPRIASMTLAAAAFECRGIASLSPSALRAL
jgi:alpha-beta hydrolase superfamily lysophospholipase